MGSQDHRGQARGERRRLFALVLTMMAVLVIVGTGITILFLYNAAFAEGRARLVETVQSQARLMEAIARFDAIHSKHDHPEGAAAATLSQIVDAHEHYQGFGKSGEFTLARREGDSIIFLLSHRREEDFGARDVHAPMSMSGPYAEPMQRALRGESGTMVGRDYRGVMVLAVYEPVDVLGFGVVAKIDLAEIRAPFIRAGIMAGGVAVLVILAGTAALFLRISSPLVHRIEESEVRIRTIVETAADGIIIIDERGVVESFNAAAEDIFGYAGEEVIGRSVSMLMPLPLSEEHDEYIARYLRTGEAKVIGTRTEVVGRRKDGTTFPMNISVSEILLGDPPVCRGFTGIVRDITERKRVEAELEARAGQQAVVAELGRHALASEDLTDLMNETVKRLAATLDVEYGKVLELLPDGKAMLLRAGMGWKEGLVGKATVPTGLDSQAGYTLKSNEPVIVEDLRTETRFSGPSLLHDHHVVSGISVIVQGREGPWGVVGAHTTRRRIFSKDEVNFLQASANVLADAIARKQAEEAVRKAQEDLLDRQRHEKELVEAELDKVREQLVSQTRLATIGQVAASIAHELRNPLGAIRNARFYLERRVPDDRPKWAEYLGIIEQEVVAADRIISNLMEMTRAKQPTKEKADLGKVVQQARQRTKGAEKIQVHSTFEPDPYFVEADPGQLLQVLGNLFSNAAEAMGGTGQITVEARREDKYDGILVRDNGPGVQAEMRDRIFEPLVTTKAKGTGLGLTICRQIIELHGGTIDLAESQGGGATFRVRLPRQNVPQTPEG